MTKITVKKEFRDAEGVIHCEEMKVREVSFGKKTGEDQTINIIVEDIPSG